MQVNTGANLGGTGQINVGGSSHLQIDGTADIARIDLINGTLTANNLIYAGNLRWNGGTINGTGLTTSGAADLISGTLETDWLITPTGTVDWISEQGTDLIINGATINNQGTFMVSSYVDNNPVKAFAKDFSASPNAGFVNEGTLIINANDSNLGDPDDVVFDLDFDNVGGTIRIQSGTFSILDGSGIRQDLVLDAGESLQGFGVFDGSVFNTAGVVTPGVTNVVSNFFEIGTLGITGDLTHGNNASIVIKLDATQQGLVSDSLNVGGTLNAGGDLKFVVINGQSAVQIASLIDNSFNPLHVGSFNGLFSSISIPSGLDVKISPDGTFTIVSTSSVLTLVANELDNLINDDEFTLEELKTSLDEIRTELKIRKSDEEEEEEDEDDALRLVCK
ncbi:MAG: hypothetical protein ACI845_002288 [Gammaproteobacteria bacterium]|jgi:hypothetical protein